MNMCCVHKNCMSIWIWISAYKDSKSSFFLSISFLFYGIHFHFSSWPQIIIMDTTTTTTTRNWSGYHCKWRVKLFIFSLCKWKSLNWIDFFLFGSLFWNKTGFLFRFVCLFHGWAACICFLFCFFSFIINSELCHYRFDSTICIFLPFLFLFWFSVLLIQFSANDDE